MWRDHSNINPLPHATVVDVTEVGPPIVLVGIGSMLLHMDSAASTSSRMLASLSLSLLCRLTTCPPNQHSKAWVPNTLS